LSDFPILSDKEHAYDFIVTRVPPRTSKGITDLLLLNFILLNAMCLFKKIESPAPLLKPGPNYQVKLDSARSTKKSENLPATERSFSISAADRYLVK
jgi:hypothetical protein